jgi:hypothetical protein
MSLKSKALRKWFRDLLSEKGLSRRLLKSTPSDGRVGQHIGRELQRRTGKPFGELLGMARKGVLEAPPFIRAASEELLRTGAALGSKIRSAVTTFTHPSWAKLSDLHWAGVLDAARFQKQLGNVVGRLRELLHEVDARFATLTSRIASKVAKANAGPRGQWFESTTKRGVLQFGEGSRADELGDILKVSLANPKKPLPRINGKNKRLWIMAILESKSLSNFKEAFEQLINDVKRILRDGVTIDGEYFSPDEIHIELPKPGTLPEDAVTELIAAIPEERAVSVAGQRALAQATKTASIQVWGETVPEAEITAAAELAIKEFTPSK